MDHSRRVVALLGEFAAKLAEIDALAFSPGEAEMYGASVLKVGDRVTTVADAESLPIGSVVLVDLCGAGQHWVHQMRTKNGWVLGSFGTVMQVEFETSAQLVNDLDDVIRVVFVADPGTGGTPA